MKRFITSLLVLTLLFFTLMGCGSTSYKEVEEFNGSEEQFSGYFTTVKQWGGGMNSRCYIIYANDTKVMYFYYWDAYRSGITPLYNADGTLQIYEAIS
jgi:hypothetical protein